MFRNDGGDVMLPYPYTIDHDDLNFFIGRTPPGERAPAGESFWHALPGRDDSGGATLRAELEPEDFRSVMNAWFEIFVEAADKR